ncbi:hypothetical protein [Marinobacter sp. SS5-14b]|uniref:hypothetical protein n=1 Tax=Marinobacter sp. SS5-14b TaxID=3050456 RepID=UPI0026E0B7F9|nr:hypothetical protein [Marinobacter sp. SS5-14b]
MTLWLSTGLIFTFAAIALILYKWWDIECIGVTPVRTLTFIAILFTSGLDVGLIMFPLTEFGGYGNVSDNPEYGFANPLAIEFGFWAFLIWGFYFLTCFYFAIIEPRVKFFEIPMVKLINNVVIIGTCAFTARFVSGIKTWKLLIAMLVVPSVAIAVWFSVLFHYHAEGLKIAAFTNLAMISVGVLMVVNSLDSLIRLYTDNLNLTARRLGRINYVALNLVVMVGLTMLFQLDFLRIQWVGALVIALYFVCFAYILANKRAEVAAIKSSPEDNILDFRKIEMAG